MLQRRPWHFKRQRLESNQPNTAAVGFLTAITHGGHISQSASLARAVVADVPEAPAGIKSVASLGAAGKWPANEERDLHRWCHNLFNCGLEKYYLKLDVHCAQRDPNYMASSET